MAGSEVFLNLFLVMLNFITVELLGRYQSVTCVVLNRSR